MNTTSEINDARFFIHDKRLTRFLVGRNCCEQMFVTWPYVPSDWL